MVTVYTLNGISVYKRYREEDKKIEFRIFEDNPYGNMMLFPETHSIGHMLDGVWAHIQEATQRRLQIVQTNVIASEE